MYYIQRTDEFDRWLSKLKDLRAKAKILARIRSAELGNLGDVAPIGEGLSELRIHFGPGYRVYLKQKGNVLLLVLCGGTKSSQRKDIERAKSLVKKYEDILNEWS
ncbi:type II toxin-antitoxin system RelE/ParE family toxin [Spongiibacter sp. KMU-158]|uniref:Type II toxin-antitoxin system RelE/ParE family toxin n=1 Tax=Spongiibacter pelagi TaxID=2760804 RepID=A0A927C093_9GAMM|nr:type II toxin-antitoxin system RelE/ParE family toxin [Spongiibacter pelagi]MBD2857647.1 type II toxin-antitoxin system RelE/ParE family toxin [Spongiibacter pelagi]